MAAPVATEKDRHSRMAYSTVRAPPKKDGGGGKYTWGSDTDPANFEYVSVPHNHVSVVTMPSQMVVAQPGTTQTFRASAAEFPALGGSYTYKPAAAWGPSTTVSTSSELATVISIPSTSGLVQPRASAEAFGPQHPRNLFAPHPRINQGYVATSGVQAIDWNAAGIPTTTLKAVNSAHLSQYAIPAPTMPSVAMIRQQQPVRVMPPVKYMKAQKPVVIHQPQHR